jgi:penicillin amidase
MKIFKGIIIILGILVILALTAGIIYLNHIKNRAVPDYNAGVDLEHLTAEVTVYRDSLGIPHIYASNEPDLYRTVGYLMAQDRLWQMDLLRRITTGRLSEVLDPGLVDADQLFRALDFTGKSEKVLAATDPGILACVEAFADGVNQFIDSHRKKLPFEFTVLGYEPDPWKPIHTANMIGYMSWGLSSGWGEESALYRMQQVLPDTLFRELLPNLKYHSTPVFPDFMSSDSSPELQSILDDAAAVVEELGLQVFTGSNNWAVSGKKSETGLPLMSNDMHLDLMAPGIWYQMHHVVEGRLNVTGVVLPGAPWVICGHNEHIAWGMTNVGVDDTDFYLETINPEDSNQYLLDGQWVDMKLVKEEIPVKGSDKPEVRINMYTHRGPVVGRFAGISDRVVSLRWQGNEYSNEMRSVHLLDRASNWDEFRDALRTFNAISQNVVYADASGNIGLQTAAGIPIRSEGGILVYPGDTSCYDWVGQVPFEALPFSYNPESGHVSSANNRTVGEDYPYYIGTWFDLPSRVERIREMLNEKELMGTGDFKRMLRDQVSCLAGKMNPVYLEALKDHTEGIYASAHQILEHWDYDMAASSPAAMIYDMLWIELIRSIFYDELGEDLFPLLYRNDILPANLIYRVRITGKSAWCDDISTSDRKETFHDNIRNAFHHAVDTLAMMFGNEPAGWRWGDLHRVSILHPLGNVKVLDRLFGINRGPYEVGGSFHTVCPYSYPLGSSFVSGHGASQRHIFNTADWDASLTVIPTGTSGVPASEHYMDQTELYVHNRFHRDHFTREAVEANMKYRAVFR